MIIKSTNNNLIMDDVSSRPYDRLQPFHTRKFVTRMKLLNEDALTRNEYSLCCSLQGNSTLVWYKTLPMPKHHPRDRHTNVLCSLSFDTV